MNEIKDERVKLPKPILHLLFSIFGISGLCIISGNDPKSYTDSLKLLSSGIFSMFAFWGIVSLINDIKASNNIKGFIKIIKSKLTFEPYDDEYTGDK